MAPCIARALIATMLTMYDEQVLALYMENVDCLCLVNVAEWNKNIYFIGHAIISAQKGSTRFPILPSHK